MGMNKWTEVDTQPTSQTSTHCGTGNSESSALHPAFPA